MTQCTYLKSNGQQCRAHAIWGSDPPRCTAHRQDGGPPLPFQPGNQYARLFVRHGYYRQPLTPPQDIVDEAAELLLKHEHLAACLAGQPDPAVLLPLCRFFSRNLGRLLALLDDFHRTSGRHPDRFLQQANQRLAERRAALHRLCHDLQTRSDDAYRSPGPRAPRYWQIYHFIVNHIRRYGVGPSLPQIQRGCRLYSNRLLDDWLARL